MSLAWLARESLDPPQGPPWLQQANLWRRRTKPRTWAERL